MKRIICCLFVLAILWNLAACGRSSDSEISSLTSSAPVSAAPAAEPSTVGDLAADLSERVMAAEEAGSWTPVTLDPEALNRFVQFLDDIEISYPYPELFELEPLLAQRMTPREPIASHRNQQPIFYDGQIDQELFFEIVEQNNTAYFEGADRNYMHVPMEDDTQIREVIRLVSESLSYELPKLSDAETARLNCLLNELKIVQGSGVSLAAVVSETNVLYVNPPMIDAGEIMSANENTYRNTLYHEAKHLLQSDCPCYREAPYQQTGTMRIAGQEDKLDPFRTYWLLEGSAEKAVCNQTGDAPLTYKYLAGYVDSLDLAALLNPQAEHAQEIEDCTLTRDIERLLYLLSAEDEDGAARILRMLHGIEIMQNYADEVQEALGLSEDEYLALRNEIKPWCCVEMARCYYRNLAQALENAGNVTLEDLLCLMTVFEGDFDYHIATLPSEMATEPFEQLWEMETHFLAAIGESLGQPQEELLERYRAYAVWQGNEGESLRASFSWLDEPKRDYLIRKAGSDSVLYLPITCDLLEALQEQH